MSQILLSFFDQNHLHWHSGWHLPSLLPSLSGCIDFIIWIILISPRRTWLRSAGLMKYFLFYSFTLLLIIPYKAPVSSFLERLFIPSIPLFVYIIWIGEWTCCLCSVPFLSFHANHSLLHLQIVLYHSFYISQDVPKIRSGQTGHFLSQQFSLLWLRPSTASETEYASMGVQRYAL